MYWRVRKPGAKHRAKHRWHFWYAWYPVRVPTHGKMSGRTMVWLQKILRKGTYSCYPGDEYWVWEYRFLNDGER